MHRILLAGLFFLLAASVSAELYQCNGVWTDRACDEERTATQKGTAVTQTPLEVRASDVLQRATAQPTVVATPVGTKVPGKKLFMIRSLQSMNKACGNYFNRESVRRFERQCLATVGSSESCQHSWSGMHSEMLGKVNTDRCRKAVFEATNEFNSM